VLKRTRRQGCSSESRLYTQSMKAALQGAEKKPELPLHPHGTHQRSDACCLGRTVARTLHLTEVIAAVPLCGRWTTPSLSDTSEDSAIVPIRSLDTDRHSGRTPKTISKCVPPRKRFQMLAV